MKSFISTDRDTILECLQGEKLLNIVPDGLGNLSLVFESANPDVSDLLTVKPDGKIIATLLYDEDDVPQTANHPTALERRELYKTKFPQ